MILAVIPPRGGSKRIKNKNIKKKLENLLGVLKWDLDKEAAKNTFNSLFEF